MQNPAHSALFHDFLQHMSERYWAIVLHELNMLNYFNFNSFPKFWSALQEELDVYDEDLIQVKSVFTALGFMTVSSLASIKTQKKLIGIESEYMKMRSNKVIFEPLCAKFEALKGIESFTSGISATMMDIITHLNPKKMQTMPGDDEAQKAMLESTKKNCCWTGQKGLNFKSYSARSQVN